MPRDTIVNEMGAQVFENSLAEAYGLIDGTRSYNGAIDELAAFAEIANDYQLVKPRVRRLSAWQRLLTLGEGTPPSATKIESALQADLCTASRHQALVYFGSPAQLCSVR